MASGDWFVVLSGAEQGRVHMAGWKHSAVLTADEAGRKGNPWWAIAHCPRCFAVVCADDADTYGDLTWAHERWHASTDHPIPADVLAKVTRP